MSADRTALQPLDVLRLITDCLSDDLVVREDARRRFQDEYGAVIYAYPCKIGGLSEDLAGDFYLYVLDKDRIFLRLRTFQGRNNIQFRTFLSYYVLKMLFLGWLRTRRDIETVSLDAPLDDGQGEETRTLHEVLPSEVQVSPEEAKERTETELARQILSTLTPEERLMLKLLALVECDLEPEDLRLLMEISCRPLDEVLAVVGEVRENLIRKDEKYVRLHDELESTWGWILLRQRELQQIDKEMRLIDQQSNARDREILLQRRASTEAAVTKRMKQRRGIIEELRTLKPTTPYSEVARLLQCPVGTVSARLTRLRARLVRDFGEGWRRRGEPS